MIVRAASLSPADSFREPRQPSSRMIRLHIAASFFADFADAATIARFSADALPLMPADYRFFAEISPDMMITLLRFFTILRMPPAFFTLDCAFRFFLRRACRRCRLSWLISQTLFAFATDSRRLSRSFRRYASTVFR